MAVNEQAAVDMLLLPEHGIHWKQEWMVVGQNSVHADNGEEGKQWNACEDEQNWDPTSKKNHPQRIYKNESYPAKNDANGLLQNKTPQPR